MTSALDGTFRSHTLTRQIETEGHVDPETDVWVEGGTVEERFRVWFKPTSNPVIAAQVGADSLSIAVRGRMLEPLTKPATSHSGSVYDVAETGQKLTLIWSPESLVAEVDREIGRAFVGKLAG